MIKRVHACKKLRGRGRERETSDTAKVCGLTGVCSVAMSTAESRSEQESVRVARTVSVLKPKIVIKTN